MVLLGFFFCSTKQKNKYVKKKKKKNLDQLFYFLLKCVIVE